MNVKKLAILMALALLCLSAAAQQKYTISGYVKDAANGEDLIGVTVYVQELKTGAVTNQYGFYSLTLPQDTYTLSFRYIGYASQQVVLDLSQSRSLNVQLQDESEQLQEVVVTAERPDANVASTDMSANSLEIKTISKMPALLGEVDIVRSIQQLPGVSSVGEGATGFNVRGGGIDQNLILLDDAPVYNSSHLFGFFSVFSPDAVKDVKLLKGGIPAQYGGRLSSLLDVRMKEGNAKNFSVSGGVGTISTRLTVEAPLVKDRSSFILTGRRSYADLFLKASSDPELKNNTLYFYDLTAKVNYKLDDKNTLYLSGYFGRDVAGFGDDFGTDWGNATGTLRWNRLISKRLFANFTGVASRYNYSLGIPDGAESFKWTSHIINYSGKTDFSWYLTPRNTINFGASAIRYRFQPGKISPGDGSIYTTITMDEQQALETALYADNEWTVSDKLSIQAGLRLSHFRYLGGTTVYDYVGPDGDAKAPVNPQAYGKGETISHYTNPEPRFSLRYSLDGSSSVKLSYNRMAQYIHLISSTTAASPWDIWRPTTNNVKPELADQLALGYFRNFRHNTIETSAEVFYKNMQNQVDFIDGAEPLLNEHIEAELLYGQGRAYGLELFAKKNKGIFTGWVSYTLSKSERKIAGINNGEWYNAKYDRTHNLSVVAIYDLSSRWSLGGNFSYATGVATTFPNARYEWGGLTVPHNTDEARNNYRVPAYHRLDLSATLNGRKKPGQRWESNWVFSLYNVYGRRNAFTVYFRQNEDVPNQTEAVRFALFGSVIPAVTYNFKF